MCSGEVDGYFYIDVQAIKCPGSHTRDAEAWAFSLFCFLLLLLLFVLLNDVIRLNYPVFDAVLLTYQDIGIITLFWFEWSQKLSRIFFVFRVALFDVDVYARPSGPVAFFEKTTPLVQRCKSQPRRC